MVADGRISLEQAFARARDERRAALVGYLPAGFPSYRGCVDALRAMVDAGTDVLEIGLPYSDPLMDGPTIQQAVDQALSAGTRTHDVLRTVEALAGSGAAVAVMTYWNPVERYGVQAFARDLAAAGGAGVITPDLIPDEAGEWLAAAAEHALEPVFLVAPSSADERIALAGRSSRGFVYAASTMGVTGTRERMSERARPLVERVRRTTELAIAVGLGVSSREQAAEVAAYADGVIVGSALVRRLLDGEGADGAAALARELAQGVRAAAADLPS